MTQRRGGFDPEQFFGPEGPFGPRGPMGPGGIFGPQGPFGTGSWPGVDLGGTGLGGDRHQHRRGGPQGRARRARRGDVRNAVLHLLAGGPMNGYQLMQEISERTFGEWQPSSGAIYPALAQLEDEGLIEQVEHDGRKAYTLTDAGRQAAADGPDPGFATGHEPADPWAGTGRGTGSAGGGRRGRRESGRGSGTRLWKAVGGLAVAAQAVGQSGDEDLTERAAGLLDRTRRELYRMLAETEVAREDDPGAGGAGPDGEDEVAEGEIIEE
ncbi:PadR family transcriptional regulator [Ornithinimicrobium sp. W1665]|uniref:PadR family transcriptional regulator n=1 Tax=Ornithinimicrobium sp. W1665 TaxID=3416666 RepID=UPI003CF19943